MNALKALVITSMVFAGACCLLLCFRRPEPGPVVERVSEAALRRIEERLERLEAAIEHATDFEGAMVRGAAKEELEGKWKLVAASCKDCHAVYRDKKD